MEQMKIEPTNNRESYNYALKLRAPLTNILGLIELLESEPNDPLKSEVIKMLRISASALDKSTRIIIDKIKLIDY